MAIGSAFELFKFSELGENYFHSIIFDILAWVRMNYPAKLYDAQNVLRKWKLNKVGVLLLALLGQQRPSADGEKLSLCFNAAGIHVVTPHELVCT